MGMNAWAFIGQSPYFNRSWVYITGATFTSVDQIFSVSFSGADLYTQGSSVSPGSLPVSRFATGPNNDITINICLTIPYL
jgi:hypothetical protein